MVNNSVHELHKSEICGHHNYVIIISCHVHLKSVYPVECLMI